MNAFGLTPPVDPETIAGLSESARSAAVSAIVLSILGLLACFALLGRLVGRRAQAQLAISRATPVPPIPQATEFDSSLTAEERAQELQSLEALMEAPAYERRG